MKESIAGARLEKLESAGHGLYIEAGELFDAKVLAFANGLALE